MMNDYFISVLNGNAFRVILNANLAKSGDINRSVKIDTGCFASCLVECNSGLSKADLRNMKRMAILSGAKIQMSYGVNDSLEYKRRCGRLLKEYNSCKGNISLDLINALLDCNAASIFDSVESFKFNELVIPVEEIKINYTRVGNDLIGMDILSKLDFHVGRAIIDSEGEYTEFRSGDIIMIASTSPTEDGYIDALEKYLGKTIVPRNVPELWRKIVKLKFKS